MVSNARILRTASTLAFALVFACRTVSRGPATPAAVPATPSQIAAIEEHAFTGGGRYLIGRPRKTLPRLDFTVLSSGVGSSVGTFVLFHGGTGRPRVGRYRVMALRRGPGDSSAFEAVYTVRRAGIVENFVAQSGELEIRESAPQQLSGVFRVIVRSYCQTAPGNAGRGCSPARPALDIPPLIVRGTFVVRQEVVASRRSD